MSEAKVEFSIGAVTFSSEGNEKWVAGQLDKILDKASELSQIKPNTKAIMHDSSIVSKKQQDNEISPDTETSHQTLVAFLNEKHATTNQINKFLATAIWLELKGKKRISTRDVTSALKNSNQSRLGNPADCLNKNVKKGYCEKDGSEFFVTQEGKNSL